MLFSSGQAVWRKLQAIGLQQRYIQDAYFASRVRHILALTFVPPNRVEDVFDILVDDNDFEELQELMDYFTTTTTTAYFNEVVFPSVLGLISPMAFPQHFPPP